MNVDESIDDASTISRMTALSAAVFAMSSLAETRTAGSGRRVVRLQRYIMTLVQQLRPNAKFRTALNDVFVSDLFLSIPMYDMGKIGIPDWILLKPNALTKEECDIIRTHTTLARDAIELAEMTLGYRTQTLQTMKDTAYSHHEKWNGRGYPEGLAGEKIPLAGRLMAIADVYEALVSKKVYRDGMSHEKAFDVITSERGKHFDPDIVDAFIAVHEEFQMIAEVDADSDVDMQKKIDYLATSIAETTEVRNIEAVAKMPWF